MAVSLIEDSEADRWRVPLSTHLPYAAGNLICWWKPHPSTASLSSSSLQPHLPSLSLSCPFQCCLLISRLPASLTFQPSFDLRASPLISVLLSPEFSITPLFAYTHNLKDSCLVTLIRNKPTNHPETMVWCLKPPGLQGKTLWISHSVCGIFMWQPSWGRHRWGQSRTK